MQSPVSARENETTASGRRLNSKTLNRSGCDPSQLIPCAVAHLMAVFDATLFAYRVRAMADADFNRWAQPNVILVATDLNSRSVPGPEARRALHAI